MSGLYNNPNFSPVRAASPQIIRHTPDVAESQYLAELISEHQKLGPFMEVLPICSRLLNQEILRVSGMIPNHSFAEFDGVRQRSPSPMASPNIMSNYSGAGGLGGWSGLLQEDEAIRGRLGYENLNDPLHILIEAKLPGHVVDKRLRQAQEVIEGWLKPVGESQDYIKRRQLQELAILNSSFREESPGPSGSMSSFNTIGMKRAKTGC
ncbi:KH domain-containing protein At2g38610-like isoform X2 [Punica granatum]|uniref:STAR protein homodimerisation region domain-containing protein n=2 Tax=Punica granatum TaxID=22663 RepID=A0A218X8Q1_PUNGR|nr:KH domain-containing protein At2g38610-like isoform X2 [Punica granatum]OWM81595.1 hypothetical protein CDL15_Pgr007633 [Punica granatum]PKI40992.1 hypothetical protein CRG98_038520 [Punica granatum]